MQPYLKANPSASRQWPIAAKLRFAVSHLQSSLPTVCPVVVWTVVAGVALYLTGYYSTFAASCISRQSVLTSAVEIQAIAPPNAGKLQWTAVRLAELKNQPGVVAACAYIQNQVEISSTSLPGGFQSLMVESGASNDPRWGGIILDGMTALLSRGQYQKLAGSYPDHHEPRLAFRLRRAGRAGVEEIRLLTLHVGGFVDTVGSDRIVIPERVAVAIENFLCGGPALDIFPALPEPSPLVHPVKETGAARARIVASDCKSAEGLILSLERKGYLVEHSLGKVREAHARSSLLSVASTAAVAIILLLASGAVFMPILIMARSRQYESALLLSLGAKASDIFSIFLLEGSGIGASAGIGALFAAWAATSVINPIVRLVAAGTVPAPLLSQDFAWLHLAVIATTLVLPLAAMLLPLRRNPDVAALVRAGAAA